MARYQVVVVGAGGFGREARNWLTSCLHPDEFAFKGFVDQKSDALADYGQVGQVIGHPDHYQPAQDDRFVLAIGDMASRRRTVESLLSRGAEFVSVIHPTALVSPSATIGKGAVIYPFAVVSNQAVLQEYAHLSLFASVGHDVHIGRYCLLAPYATVNGFSTLDDEVYMSTHSTVVPERHVGRNSTISANSAVLQDVSANSFVFGVTCKQTRKFKVV
ncbi:MAG: acetyltransferase [Planctomycetota bacterium]|nr:acetyltransferase [Planctomycetota bacterium]